MISTWVLLCDTKCVNSSVRSALNKHSECVDDVSNDNSIWFQVEMFWPRDQWGVIKQLKTIKCVGNTDPAQPQDGPNKLENINVLTHSALTVDHYLNVLFIT